MKKMRREKVLELMGESVHTSFRKGAFSTQAGEAWDAIRRMPDWEDAVDWMVWALEESGVIFAEECKKG